MFIINMSQLASILDVGKFTLYPRLNYLRDTENALQRDYQIDIDEFLSEHKVNTFEFLDSSFVERLKVYSFPAFIAVDDVKSILGVDNYELRKLRVSGSVVYKSVSAKRYLYDTNSVLKYASVALKKERPPYRIMYSKQFFSPTDVQNELKEQHGITLSRKTLYRYIYDYNIIPCIKVSGNLRIPILEFKRSLPKIAERACAR